MGVEQFSLSPYAQLENYPPLSSKEIERRWLGWRDGGKVKYGCWAKEPIPVEQYGPLAQKFIDIISEQLRATTYPSIADIGCGNGTGFIAGVSKVMERVPALSVLLSDIQPDAVEETEKLYGHVFGEKITLVVLQADISDRETAQRIITANGETQVDALVCDSVLHFLTNEKLQNGLQTLQAILKLGGIGYLSVCSIYNPASVGSKADTNALKIVHQITNGATSENPVVFFQPEMGVLMTFFTQPSLRRILMSNGLEIVELEDGYNSRLRNGLGDKYPEHYCAIVRKGDK
jgi:SAM-dependent methyltransferase